MPLWRKEISYSGTVGLTKVFAKHEMRTGFDFVRLELNHRQAEWGDYGLKGGFSFSNNTTGAVGYTSPGWNSFAAFLMGLPNYYAEGHPDGRDDRPREPVRVLPPRPVDRVAEADGERAASASTTTR